MCGLHFIRSDCEITKIKINCAKVEELQWQYEGAINTCETGSDLQVLTDQTEVENDLNWIMKRYENWSIRAIHFSKDSLVVHVPKKITEFFRRLNSIQFVDHLETLHENDLEQFGDNLEYLKLSHCKVKYLLKDLFKHNPNMKYILIFGTPLHYIEPGFLKTIANIESMKHAEFGLCDCINDSTSFPKTAETMTHTCNDHSVVSAIRRCVLY